MKLLLVGNGNHPLLRYYAKWLKGWYGEDLVIDIFPIRHISEDDPFRKIFRRIYRTKGRNYFLRKIPFVNKYYGRLVLQRSFMAIVENYDICHLHFLEEFEIGLEKHIQKICKNLVLSIWGSDFYRRSQRTRMRMLPMINAAGRITFTNEKTLNAFRDVFRGVGEKLDVCRFASATLEELSVLQKMNQKEARARLNLPHDGFIVTLGTNADKGQQHLGMIESLKKMKEEILSGSVLFLLPLTYRKRKSYLQKVKSYLDESSLPYVTFDELLGPVDAAILTKSTDVLVQVQQTDQFSGAMLEHLFAGKIVITGHWLPYDTLDQMGIWCLKVNSVDEVGKKVADCISNFEQYSIKTTENPSIVWHLSSAENNMMKWVSLYQELHKNGHCKGS